MMNKLKFIRLLIKRSYKIHDEIIYEIDDFIMFANIPFNLYGVDFNKFDFVYITDNFDYIREKMCL